MMENYYSKQNIKQHRNNELIAAITFIYLLGLKWWHKIVIPLQGYNNSLRAYQQANKNK